MNDMSSPDADSNSAVPKHLESLATTVFRSLFPPINPQATPLKSIRRVVLINREQEEDGTFILNFRHYAITTKLAGVSKQLRRINAAEKLVTTKTSRHGQMPNLGKLQDISDYMIGGEGGDGYMTDATSGSEADTDAEVEVVDNAPRKVMSTKARLAAELNAASAGPEEATTEENVERRAVKLVELGPRMRLRLTKVEEGMCGGKIMWHEYVKKTNAEVKELEKRWQQRRQEKDARKREQKANVERKKAEKEARKGRGKGDDENDDDEDDDMEDYSDYEDYNHVAASRKKDEEKDSEGGEDEEWEDEE